MTNDNKVIGYSSGAAIAEQLNKVDAIDQRTADLEQQVGRIDSSLDDA